MKKIVEITTVVVAVLLVIATTLVYLSGRMGFNVHTVISDSMNPTLDVGTMVVSKMPDVNTLDVGDVIIFKPVSVGEKPIIHRIVAINKSNPPSFQTKGDNPAMMVDEWEVPAANIIGKMEFSSPLAGYITGFFTTQIGLILALIVPALILIIMVFKSFWRELVKYIKSNPAKEG